MNLILSLVAFAAALFPVQGTFWNLPPGCTTSSCTTDSGCQIFDGPIDYVVIGNSMSYSEDRSNCGQKTSSSASLSLPTGAKIVAAFLQWSGSGGIDSKVKLNGNYVTASKTYSQFVANSWNFFGAYSDVTTLVQNSGSYEVSDLTWSSDNSVCQANAAYGAWSLVVVFTDPSTSDTSRIHVCQDKFRMTYPAGDYSTTIGCVKAVDNCPANPKFSVVTFESDNYKGEKFYINDVYIGDNIFNGSTAPNLDIELFNVKNYVKASTTQLTYKITSYLTNTVWGSAIEGLFDFVKVLKYPTSCVVNQNPIAKCKDASVCAGQSITVDMIDNGSSDPDGTIASKTLSNSGPFNTVGSSSVTLTVTDNKGAKSTCSSTVTVRDCRSPPMAKCKDLLICDGDTITPEQVGSGSSDPDGFIKTLSLSSTGPFPIGKTTVTLTATDNDGLSATCTATITVDRCKTPSPTKAPVRPTAAPSASKKPPIAVCKDQTICKGDSITASQVGSGSSDPDGTVTDLSLSDSGPFGTVGTKTVTLTVTDNDGLQSTCKATITVETCKTPSPTKAPVRPTAAPSASKKPPIAVCKDQTVCKGDSITASQVGSGSSDPDGTVTDLSLSDSGPFNTIGTKTVTLTVTDNDGLQDTCKATITVETCKTPSPTKAPVRPTAAPSASKKPPIAVCKDQAICKGGSITASDVGSGSTDPDGTVTDLSLNDSGPFNTIGTKTVTLTVTDNDGLQDTCKATITVESCVTPSPSKAPVKVTAAPSVSKKPPVAVCQNLKVCLGDSITAKQVGSGSFDPDGIIKKYKLNFYGPFTIVGKQKVKLTVTDNDGLKSTCRATITVESCKTPSPTKAPVRPTAAPSASKKPPIAVCKDQTICKGGSITASDVGSGSTDPDGTVTDLSLNDSGPFNTIGTKTVTLTVTDNDGLKDTCKATVIVESCKTPSPTKAPVKPTAAPSASKKPPIAVCKDQTICKGGSITASQVGSGSSDPDGTVTDLSLNDSGPFNTIGTKTVTLTVTDNDGLQDTCKATITVESCSTPPPSKAPVKTPAPVMTPGPAPAPTKAPTGVCKPKIKRFDLVDTRLQKVVSELPKYVNYSELYGRYFTILAIPENCDTRIRSVRLTLGTHSICARGEPFSLYGDTSGVFKGVIWPLGGPYTVTATPYTSRDCSTGEEMGLSQDFFVVAKDNYMDCPGAPVYFDLYDADTDTSLGPIKEGDKICKPSFQINFKADVINCDGDRVMSTTFALAGDVVDNKTLNGPEFFMYGVDSATGDILGTPSLPVGKYSLTATTYPKKDAGGTAAATLTTNFEFISCRRIRG